MLPHAPTTDPRFAEIESHRPYLLRYALAQLRDAQMAEGAVQEALVAALESIGSFGGKSSLRTVAHVHPAVQGDRPAAPRGGRPGQHAARRRQRGRR